MSFPAGWYDDPQDPTQQRYWDGGFWTDYRRPREGPPPYPGQFGQPAAGQPGSGQAQQQGQQGFVPGLGQPGMGREGYGPQQGYSQQQGFGYGPRVPATPDGQPLAGWWKRVLARIIDSFVLFFITMPFAGYFYWRAIEIMIDELRDDFDAASRGAEPPPINTELPPELYKWLIPVAVISLVISFLYEYLMLTRRGATLGKMAVGISVRLRDVAGPPPGSAVAKRFGVDFGFQLLGWIPVVGTLFSFLGLINYLWPLWDDKKQALHDKAAKTNVVVGRQS
ncbi:RDD family protein [Kribbella sp. CA-293567]|uniref:RDD family protein n=1 Tax=Kribbella sp. CA-293567 TaxID=3002436 RepID=UPI0022DD909D|nr:RDD family protein [Kribbella sp. CA-293567]WBQ04588.1 RDD family protein [Kribbella sp. CA-293567]